MENMMNMWLYSSKPRSDPLVQNEGASMHCTPYIEQMVPWSWSITASATCRALQPPVILAAANLSILEQILVQVYGETKFLVDIGSK